VIRGCVPKKLMVFASGYPDMVEDARAYGWDAQIGDFSWAAFRGKLDAELNRLEGVYRKLLGGSDVTIHDGRARVTGPNAVQVNGQNITAKHILVATGGHPVLPDLPNADLGITSNDIFLLDELPKSILIVGGGLIACEFACILHGLGVEVTQYYRGAQVLRGFDDEARGLLADMMVERGINLHLGTNIVEMAPASADHAAHPTGSDALGGEGLPPSKGKGGPIWVKSTNGSEQVFDQVMFATGRSPNTNGLGLEEAGVTMGRRGEVVVDAFSATNVPSIYAVGDVTNRVQLTPVAIREGMAFVETVYKDNPTAVDHEMIPSAVFTTPELGTVGMTEEEAREAEPIEVYATSFKPMQQAFAGREDRVLMKLIVSQATRKVLGCHIVADHAGELIQMVGIAVKNGLTKEDFDRTVAVHPTMSEELVTMKEPVRAG